RGRAEVPAARDLLDERVCGRGRPAGVHRRHDRPTSPCRNVRGQDLERRQTCRPPGGATHEVRASHQPQDRQSAWPHHPTVAAAPGGSGNRVSRPRSTGRSRSPDPTQLPLPAPPSKPKARADTPEQIAKVAIARRTKPSPVPGNVKMTVTLDLKREL